MNEKRGDAWRGRGGGKLCKVMRGWMGERERMSNVVIKRRWDAGREMNGAESRKIGQEAGSE